MLATESSHVPNHRLVLPMLQDTIRVLVEHVKRLQSQLLDLVRLVVTVKNIELLDEQTKFRKLNQPAPIDID